MPIYTLTYQPLIDIYITVSLPIDFDMDALLAHQVKALIIIIPMTNYCIELYNCIIKAAIKEGEFSYRKSKE
jgi:hypothetical protein